MIMMFFGDQKNILMANLILYLEHAKILIMNIMIKTI